MEKKPFYRSKTVWAAVATFIIGGASAVWGETSPLVAVLIAVASAFGLYGRAKATTRLGK
jgi:asparagine N-glycosylation enzyme membrane subunit Stt3